MIIKKIVVGELMTNCYLLGCKQTKAIAIIDPGAESEKIIKEIDKANLKPKFIILTHGHGDHIGAINGLKKKYNIPVYIHENDKELLENSYLNFSAFMFGKETSIIADKKLKDNDTIVLGNFKIKVLHTPGHTPGSIVLKCNNILFSGDTLFQNGIGRTDLPGGSYDKIINSIKTKILSLPDDTIVYPGHGPETNVIEEKTNNYYLK